MFGKKKNSDAANLGKKSPHFDEKTSQEVNKITPAGGHHQDRMIDFRPLWDTPRDSWERLIAADPVAQDAANNIADEATAAGVDDATPPADPALLDKILAGETTTDSAVAATVDPADVETASVADAEPSEVPVLEPSLAYSDVPADDPHDPTGPLPILPEDESPLAEVAQPHVVEDPDVQRTLDEEAAAIDATTSQNYIISMAAQRERREKEKREIAPIFIGIAAAIVVVAILAGLGFAFPNKTLSRTAAQSSLRNAGVEALHKAPSLADLDQTAMMVQQRTVTRNYEEDGIEYTVTATEKTVIGATTVKTEIGEPKISFATPADEARWEELDKPRLPGMAKRHTRRGGQRVHIAGTTIQVSALSSWPTDINKLTQTLAGAIPGVQPVRSALVLATVPGLKREFYHALYGVLSQASDARMVTTPKSLHGLVPDSAKTVEFPASTPSTTVATITFNPYTGQVFAVENATPQEQRILIEASGYLNCVDTFGDRAPGSISMGCDTDALLLKGLTWQNWGKARATAKGTTKINDCDPSCREGTKHAVPVEVVASNPQPCGYRVRIYTKLEATFPEGTDDLQQPAVQGEFPCPIKQ